MTPYHLQENGIVESQNKKIIACLQKHVGDKKNFWEPYLITAVLEYNCTINSTTGETPYFLVFGREPRTVLEMLYKVAPNTDPNPHWRDNFVVSIHQGLMKAAANIKEAQKVAANLTSFLSHKIWQMKLMLLTMLWLL